MKFNIAPSRAAALVALIASAEAARHGHSHLHRRSENVSVEKRGGQCQFPSNAGLVSVTPNEENAGWAMSPNQPCKPGNYCPYACPAGQVSMQWDPKATSYSYPMSMNGGLYCNEDGEIEKPFPSKPYCQDGTGAIKAKNKAGKAVSFCQTVLPGNEAMLIPTLIEELETLAVPDMSYWCETAAQYYINAPGISAEEGCVWGTNANPVGNWSPYTAGANTVTNGDTYVKIGWNPIYLEPTTPFRNIKPTFGIEIECEGGGCNGLPCKIDPSTMSINHMEGSSIMTGAGGATGCTVTVPKGSTAHIVVWDVDGSDSDSGSSSSETVSISTSSATSTSTSTSTPTPTPTTTSTTETPTSTPTSTPTPTTTTSTSTSTSTPTPTSPSTSTVTATSTVTPSSSTKLPKSSPSLSYTYRPHVFTGSAEIVAGSSATGTAVAAASSSTGAPGNGASTATVSMASLLFGAVAVMVMNY
ncbi:hypothetical protein N7481_009314 [Penicillium waksmanii]|uniref:uncharacterized protein n=1 Tax=Penicillium waksmanii TaxID=69791 RepID=UPI002548CE89|nr:uncharacterized protein N7481_009314 [Penicillium waksmanii]KAJ5975607.1 hypothetical protein N7481_009314 [Penicillium waksmanii]